MDEEFVLYGGRVKLQFKETSHRYTVWVDGKKSKCPSVTTITGVVDKSGPIQTWAIRNTVRVCRELIQPETTYSDAELEKVFEFATQESYKKKKEAADIGTEVHKWIEQWFHGADMVLPTPPAQRSCVVAALDWFKTHKIDMLQNEKTVYSLLHGVSGRLDGIANIDQKKTLIDYKTGNNVYPEAHLQTAAYQFMYEEETGDPIEQRAIIRLGKESGTFYATILPASEYHPDMAGFLGALDLYKRLREIEKLQRKIEVITNRDWIDEAMEGL